MANISLEIKGVKETSKFLNKKEKEIQKDVTNGMVKATFFVQGEVKQSIAGRRAEHVSVDTGRFLNSVDTKTSKDNGVVFSLLPYADFLEDGSSKFNGRHHFRNTANRNKTKVKDILQKSINI